MATWQLLLDENYQEILSSAPSNSLAYAYALYKTNRFNEIQTDNLYLLAQMKYRQGRYEEARDIYQKILPNADFKGDIYTNIAACGFPCTDLVEDANYYLNLSIHELIRNNTENSMELLEKASDYLSDEEDLDLFNAQKQLILQAQKKSFLFDFNVQDEIAQAILAFNSKLNSGKVQLNENLRIKTSRLTKEDFERFKRGDIYPKLTLAQLQVLQLDEILFDLGNGEINQKEIEKYIETYKDNISVIFGRLIGKETKGNSLMDILINIQGLIQQGDIEKAQEIVDKNLDNSVKAFGEYLQRDGNVSEIDEDSLSDLIDLYFLQPSMQLFKKILLKPKNDADYESVRKFISSLNIEPFDVDELCQRIQKVTIKSSRRKRKPKKLPADYNAEKEADPSNMFINYR